MDFLVRIKHLMVLQHRIQVECIGQIHQHTTQLQIHLDMRLNRLFYIPIFIIDIHMNLSYFFYIRAWWPTTSSYYTLRTADTTTPGTDPTTYTSGQMLELHLRVNDLKRK